jgi:hypothetical protein
MSDAAYLAHLLRLGVLPTGHILAKPERAARDLARKRLQLVRTRTAQVLAVENLFARNTGARPTSNAVKRFRQEEIDSVGLDPDVALAIKTNVAIIGALKRTNRAAGMSSATMHEIAFAVRAAHDGAGHWRDAGDHDHVGDRPHRALSEGESR